MDNSLIIKRVCAIDKRFDLKKGAGSDSVNTTPQYAYAVCSLISDSGLRGTGLSFTLGKGNDLVCKAIEYLAPFIEGKEIEELMADFGNTFNQMANAPNLRWLGPHKGIVHLALASVTNACFDLWAKNRSLPLWKLMLDLSPEELVNTLDLSYLEEILPREEAVGMLVQEKSSRKNRMNILTHGYKGYDTSVGWFNYLDHQLRDNVKQAIENGFTAVKLKVGSQDKLRDIKRANIVRETAGPDVRVMLDANQQWNLPQAIEICRELSKIDPYWVEEPTHPDDISGHKTLADKIHPVKLAIGEHVPNRIVFKNFLLSGSVSFNQVDTVRVGGISEFITISLLSKKLGVPVVPHVGDMGQIHQHLVLFNHIAMDHEALFLEYIPHLKEYFRFPVQVNDGHYRVPEEPGISADFKEE
ncbi:MAG: enolase C-terminal domain-like protein [Cyclobacteriaceae bacterium]